MGIVKYAYHTKHPLKWEEEKKLIATQIEICTLIAVNRKDHS